MLFFTIKPVYPDVPHGACTAASYDQPDVPLPCNSRPYAIRLSSIPLLSATRHTASLADGGHVGEYDPDAQIHAGWLLSKTGHVLADPNKVRTQTRRQPKANARAQL